jgi:hypothetical protein
MKTVRSASYGMTVTTTKRVVERYLQATSFSRVLPDFLIIGTQRGGTTSLYRYLAQHPAVAPTLVSKGVHYFDVHYERPFSWYRGHFVPRPYRAIRERQIGERVLTGEASPYYLFHPLAPSRVAEALPNAKLIAILRDPVTRAFSQFRHEVDGGYEDMPTFEGAIDAEPGRLAGEIERLKSEPGYASFHHEHHSYLARGLYVEQLRAWLSLFAREQLLVIESERLCGEPDVVYGEVLTFLGLPQRPLRSHPTYNTSRRSEPMRPETRVRLAEYFMGPSRELAELLGRDPGWEERWAQAG